MKKNSRSLLYRNSGIALAPGGNQRRKMSSSSIDASLDGSLTSGLSSKSRTLKIIANDEFEKCLNAEEVGNPDLWKNAALAARKYLFNVSHEKKLKFNATKRVLNDSVINLHNFDPIGASKAFENLMKYAINLLLQPWRKDFWKVRLHTNFFVQHISSYLVNAEDILEAMGYQKDASDSTSSTLITSSGFLDFDIVKEVALDCLMASQECLILQRIVSRVQEGDMGFSISIPKIFEFRKEKVGDVEAVCSLLSFEAKRRHYEEPEFNTEAMRTSQTTLESRVSTSECSKIIERLLTPVDSSDLKKPSITESQSEADVANHSFNRCNDGYAFGDTVDSRLFVNDLSSSPKSKPRRRDYESGKSFSTSSNSSSSEMDARSVYLNECDKEVQTENTNDTNNNNDKDFGATPDTGQSTNYYNSYSSHSSVSLEPYKHLTFTKLSFQDCATLNSKNSKKTYIPPLKPANYFEEKSDENLNWLESFDRRPQEVRQMEQQYAIDHRRVPYSRIPKDVYNDNYFPRVKAKSKTKLL